MKQHAPVKKNDELTVTITDLTYQGLGVAKVDGYPLFVTGVLPAERVVIHVTKVQKNFGYARVVRWETTSQTGRLRLIRSLPRLELRH